MDGMEWSIILTNYLFYNKTKTFVRSRQQAQIILEKK